MIEFRHLRYFVAVAEELHYGRAARRLHMAQSPLSQQILRLEREVGVDLIDRPHGVVGLTEAGKVFLEDCRSLLVDLDVAVERAQRAARGEVGRLGVGYVNEISADLLALGLRTFKQRGHDIEIQLAEGTTGALLDALRNGRMDVVFVRSPIHRDDIHYEQLIEEHLVLVSPAGTRVDDRAASLGALREARWIVPSRDAARGLRDDIDRAFEGAGYRPIVVREAPTLTAVLLLVAGGIGCGLVPASVARLHPLPGVHHVRLDGPAPVTSAGMAWRNTDQSMALQHFLGAVRQTARDRSATPEE